MPTTAQRENLAIAYGIAGLYAALFSTTANETAPGLEVTGGSPAYRRQLLTWVSGAVDGRINATATFDIPAGVTVGGVGLYNSLNGGNYLDGGPLSQPRFATQGRLTLNLSFTVPADPTAPPEPSAVRRTMTWVELSSLTETSGSPVIIAHRGGGGEIAVNNALSGIDFAVEQGMLNNDFIVADGGDNWVGADGTLLNSHDADATVYMQPGGLVRNQTAATWSAQRLRDFPLYRGTVSAEAPPTTRQWLEKLRDLRKFTFPEDKAHTADSRRKLVDLILELGMRDTVQVQSFQAADLGPAKAAGISVGLLQSEGNNIGAAAILTCVNGGPPDLVLYDPRSRPGTDDNWVRAMIDNGIALQVGTLSRRYDLDSEKARVAALGGHITIVPSDNPFYIGRSNVPITRDRFDTQWWEHGLIPSDTSADPRIVDEADGGRSLRFGASTASQWALMGSFADEARGCWKTLETDLVYEALDTTTSRWAGISWAFADDRNFHDGTSNGPGCLSFILRQTGQIQLYNRSSSSTTTVIADTLGSSSVGTRSDATLVPITAGQTVRVRLENLVDDNGAFTGQIRATRLDTGHWVMSRVATAPVRGPYMHVGKNGATGSVIRFRNIEVTPRLP